MSSLRDWKKVPPVWLTPPAAMASGRSRISLWSTLVIVALAGGAMTKPATCA